ncbi:MAG: NAD-dependent deacetylase [Sandaracinaceae bacterium]
MDRALGELLSEGATAEGPLLFLTGAGISAESGIPTFRGPEGYWTAGSRHYHPQELATREAFQRMPEEVWRWYLYRRSVCHRAEPNEAHRALARLERALGDRFLLITQNVDGLHLRAGNTPARTYQIHGNIDFCRCEGEDSPPRPLPDEVGTDWDPGRPMDDATRRLLSCCAGGGLSRPHVLWFDEFYDEDNFRWDSSLAAASRASLLVIVGTSGSTNLPLYVAEVAARRGTPMVVVNRDESPFTTYAQQSERAFFWRASAAEAVPAVVDAVIRAAPAP